jgi:hypothetical protein
MIVSEPSEYLSVRSPRTNAAIDDSINDRDLDSSVAKMATNRLSKVPEVKEQEEATIEQEELFSSKIKTEDLMVKIQKSKTLVVADKGDL